jgi:aldehyde:ferredoxin oxidoreductase
MTQQVVNQQNLKTAKYSMCFCDYWGTVTFEIMAELLSSGLGETITTEETAEVGEFSRVYF